MNNCFADFLQNEGLYRTIDVTEQNINMLCDLIGGKVKISAYCTACKVDRVFSMTEIKYPHMEKGGLQYSSLSRAVQNIQGEVMMLRDRVPGMHNTQSLQWYWVKNEIKVFTDVMVFHFQCAMDPNHKLDYIVRTEGNTLIKIGQYPSVADLAFPELDEFKKVINDTTRKELRRAIGLQAQGIGVGSYVYLRRIFERILDEAKDHAARDGAIDLSAYSTLKVQDRMKLLRAYLPEMINSNPIFYSIVSKGIHELSEEDCLKYFPVLKEAIFMILRQWNQKRQELEAAKRLTAALSNISTELKPDK